MGGDLGVVAGRFEVEGLAGEGGMGRVYRARDLSTGGAVALKVLHDAEEGGRFAREIRLLAALRHPGIVRYVAHGATDDDKPWLAMEWLEGETLLGRLEQGRMSVAESVALGLGLARALGAVHRAGIVHRDLKPSNVFLAGGEVARPVILDFGIARTHAAEVRLTLAGAIVGTPGYMAPEQLRGDARVDARVDVYALGCLVFRCLAGQDAFASDGSIPVLFKVVLEDAPRVASLRPDVPRALDELCAAMLARERARRTPDAGAVVAALEAIEAHLGGTAPSIAPPPMLAPRITDAERRLTCLVLASAAGDALTGDLAVILERHRARVARIEGGTLAVVLSGPGSPADLAARAARCALALRDALGGAPVALAATRAGEDEAASVEEARGRAARILAAAGERGAASTAGVDELTAGLLGDRFDVRKGPLSPAHPWLALHGENAVFDPGRRLLGRPTPCLGRDRELTVLESLFVQTAEEQSAYAVLVTGPAGAGKSRLSHELLRRLRERGERVEVWKGAGDSLGAGAAYGLLARAFRHGAGVLEGDPPEVRRDRLRRRALALGVSPLAIAFLCELDGAPVPDDEGAELRAARADPHLMGDKIQRAAEDLLRAACARGPLILVLEDLHWGDLPTVRCVGAALQRLDDRPLFVLALARPEVHRLFPTLWDDRAAQTIPLPPLPRRAAERLVRHLLGDAAPPDQVSLVVERAGGNALYLEELVRAATSGQVLSAGPDAAIPDALVALVEGRVAGLDAELRRALRAASVFGRTFPEEGVSALLGEPAGQHLEALADAEIIGRRAAFGDEVHTLRGEHTFRHALVRDAAYRMLTADDRALGHRLAGEYLEHAGRGGAMELAEHFERGGEPARAVAHYRRAAEEALAGHDLGAALARAERGVASGAAGTDLGELRRIQAEAHNWRGELDRAGACAAEAGALLPVGSASWYRAAKEETHALGLEQTGDRLHALCVAAQAAVPAAGAATARTMCLAAGICELVLNGRCTEADALLADLDADGHGDPQARTLVASARAFRASVAGDLARAREALEVAVAAAECVGDIRNACNARCNLGFVLAQLGDLAGAEAALAAVLPEAERLGLGDLAALAEQNLGYVLLQAGRVGEALDVEARAAATLARLGNPRLEGGSRIYLARIHHAARDLPAAESEARAALALLGTGTPLRPLALAVLSRILSALGRRDDAFAAADEAFSLLSEAGSLEEGDALIRLVHVEALTAAGRFSDAEAALAAARDRLLARATSIADPLGRARFLSSVVDNAATLAAKAR